MPKLVNGISQKMKNFCHEYALTGDATHAYLSAYNTTNRITAGQEASRLLQRDDITEYMKKLNQPTINKITNDREKKRQILWKGIERCIAKEDESGAARYMDILNKMDSEYVNINRTIDNSTEKLSSLNIDQLKDLIGDTTENTETTESA
jgi:phage terminase small subunit